MFEKILKQKALIRVMLILISIGGVFSYINMGKLEDAEIPIKTALIMTPYNGASAHEVELEVTDPLEKALQKLENVDNIQSRSMPGMSEITINISSKVTMDKMSETWEHLRRKINDAAIYLPNGVTPIVKDDFSDTYGSFIAVTSDGYSMEELEKYVNKIKQSLLEINDVRKVELYGNNMSSIEICLSDEKLSSLGVNPLLIVKALNDNSSPVNAGNVVMGDQRLRISVGDKFSSKEELADMVINVPFIDGSFRLGDIADIREGVIEPIRDGMTFNGMQAISIGISTESGVNVVDVGRQINEKLDQIKSQIPIGIELHYIYSQPERVVAAMDNFMNNLFMSVIIVIVVLLFSMGLRSGLLISSGLVFTILGTILIMYMMDIELHRTSLGAIILAMGMLVDNSIVVVDGILVDLKRGVRRRYAFLDSARKTAFPLLGATLVAILAFMPLGKSPGEIGDFLHSIYVVIAISLLLSWLFAMIQTPFMAKFFYGRKKMSVDKDEIFNSKIYIAFKNSLRWALYRKNYVMTVSVIVLISSVYFFRYVKTEFIPSFDYNQFIVEYYLPKSSNVEAVQRDIFKIRDTLLSYNRVENVTTALNRTPMRYSLIRPLTTPNDNYGELIVESDNYDGVLETLNNITDFIAKNFPDAEFRCRKFCPVFSEYNVEAQFSGHDPMVLRDLAEQAKKIMRDDPLSGMVTDNWKDKTKVLTPAFAPQKATELNITRKDVANSLAIATTGMPVGVMYQGDIMKPLVLRLDSPVKDSAERLINIPVWGQMSLSSVPLSGVTDSTTLAWEDKVICRYNGKRSIKAQCAPAEGVVENELLASLKDKIEAIPLPVGYSLKWEGNTSDSEEAMGNLFKYLPMAIGIMVLIIISLFNNFRQPAIIFSVVPFAIVGIVFGFLSTGKILNFVGVIGVLGLIGMMIKNSVVLLDQINININSGEKPLQATIDSTISRMLPVMMASMTTILGMLPLMWDILFQSLAITIMFGLMVGTLITLYIVPVMYAILYKIDTSELK